ncbi:hypothetical protein KM043_016550 [Ampulex compressa]|nr:hypothetical protein KM043_016550 [Ampulex compressa]
MPDPGNTRGYPSIRTPVRFKEIFGLMARIHDQPYMLNALSHSGRENPRYNGPDTMRGNIQDMQISVAFPIIFGERGGKGFEKTGTHAPDICIPPRAICIRRNLHRACTRVEDDPERLDRKGESIGFVALVSPPYAYGYICLLKGYEQGARKCSKEE